MGFWTEYLGECKSRLSAVARSLLASRNRWKEVAQQRLREALELKKEIEAGEKERDLLQNALDEAKQECDRLREELQRSQEARSIELPADPPLLHHQFEPRMIELSVNLARRVGLRASIRAMREFFDWLGIQVRLPTWQAVRLWMQRLGIARTERIKKLDGRIWIVDHSNQIGQEKVLLILGVDPNNLPAPGQTLRQTDVEVLASIPGTSWKREDVARVYKEIADKFGTPRVVLVDGAVELRDAIDHVDWPGKTPPIALRDLKHFLANRLEAMLKKDQDFEGYVAEVGKTRCAIQQTELSHLNPPSSKSKARFMNLKPLLEWGKMMLWYLSAPNGQQEDAVTPARIQQKLGWIKGYDKQLARWNAYQQVISASLTWINENGVRQNSARELKEVLQKLPEAELGKSLADEAIEFVKLQAMKIKPGERLWLSTEIIESVFGRYKQFEGQHSKGGFTTLLPSLASLLGRTSAKEITTALRQVPVKLVKQWIEKNLPNTNQAKRRRVSRQYRTALRASNKTHRATESYATT
jgi:hypothetical protein